MSVLYRALWSDTSESDRRGVVDLARVCFSRWALDDGSAKSLEDGETVSGSRSISVRTLDNDGLYGVEATISDAPRKGAATHTVWTTTMRVLASESAVHMWVENGMETDDLAQQVKVGRPRLVDHLLALPGKAFLGGSGVFTDVVSISAGEVPVLVDWLRDPTRTLPFIVFSEPSEPDEGRWLARAEKTARRAGGVATVTTLDHDAVTAFKRALGTLSVWGGGIRTYVPAPVETEADGWRHRYIPAFRLGPSDSSAVDRLVFAVTQLSTRRRVPEVFAAFVADASRSVDVVEVARIEEEWEFKVELELEERGEVERALAKANGHLLRLTRALRERAMDDLIWETHDRASDGDLPDAVQDVSEAVTAAQEHLGEWVVVPDSAPRELDGIDSASNAYAWGNTTWSGLRALSAYAQAKKDGFPGDFWVWCERGEPLAWPATNKKLAMRESETVQNNPRHMQARLFDVDPLVAEPGRIHMEAHLKISEGGGNLAPRVYFHDDTGGATGKVHVGFVGPHYLVPNTKA